MTVFRTISNLINKILNAIAASLLALMTAIFFINIIQRYVIGQGFHGNEEIARFAMIWMVFICGVILTKDDAHLSVSILENALSGSGKKILKLIQRLIMLVFFSIMASISLEYVRIGAKQLSPNLNLPMSFVYIIFPVSFILMILQLVFVILDDWVKKPKDSFQEETTSKKELSKERGAK